MVKPVEVEWDGAGPHASIFPLITDTALEVAWHFPDL